MDKDRDKLPLMDCICPYLESAVVVVVVVPQVELQVVMDPEEEVEVMDNCNMLLLVGEDD